MQSIKWWSRIPLSLTYSITIPYHSQDVKYGHISRVYARKTTITQGEMETCRKSFSSIQSIAKVVLPAFVNTHTFRYAKSRYNNCLFLTAKIRRKPMQLSRSTGTKPLIGRHPRPIVVLHHEKGGLRRNPPSQARPRTLPLFRATRVWFARVYALPMTSNHGWRFGRQNRFEAVSWKVLRHRKILGRSPKGLAILWTPSEGLTLRKLAFNPPLQHWQ